MIIDITQIPVYYINLDSSAERREAISSALRQAGFTNVIRFKASTGEHSVHGCAKSHHELMSLVKHSGPFLVLEDDAALAKDFTTIVEVPDDADAVYLGTTIAGRQKDRSTRFPVARKINEEYYQIYNFLTGHAILYINPEYQSFLKRALKVAVDFKSHQDIVRAETMKFFTVYVRNKPIFFQNDQKDYTDSITQTYIDDVPTKLPSVVNLGLWCQCYRGLTKKE
jgi:GR25 family glycosyltransferase involved in LPS biosynthesis